MKYEKGSVIDNMITKFPVRYIFYLFILWLIVIGVLIYYGTI